MAATTLREPGITPYLLFLVFAATLGPAQFGYHLVSPAYKARSIYILTL